MRCPSCGFHNLPTQVACGRCGSLLDLAGVSVQPPRAAQAGLLARWSRRLERRLGRRHGRPSARERRSWRDRLLTPWPGVSIVACGLSLLPGLGQRAAGQRARGWWLLGGWTVALVLARRGVGTWPGRLLAATALGVHVLACTLLLEGWLRGRSLGARLLVGLGCWLTLSRGLYLPATGLARKLVSPAELATRVASPLLADGDYLRCHGPWLGRPRPQRGDLVLYRQPELRAGGVVARAGQGLDRILGLAGDRVEIAAGEVRVDGRLLSPEEGPVARLPPHVTVDVSAGAGELVIFPSLQEPLPPAEFWRHQAGSGRHLVVLAESEVLGGVLWRLRPWRRFGPLPAPGHVPLAEEQ